MPGVTHCESQTVLSESSPPKRNRLSLRFFQKKDTKRALEFTEASPAAESQNDEEKESEICSDQVVPTPQLSPPACCVKKEGLIPFVGLNNLGNTCYLNSILQVLCYCPGFKSGIKFLSEIISKKAENISKEREQTQDKDTVKHELPASYDVICSLSSLVHSMEHLQITFLSNPENYDSELAAQPRRLLNTLREVNPMYEGYLQHDAQEVLQCILGNIQEACQIMKKEIQKNSQMNNFSSNVQDTAKSTAECNGLNGGDPEAINGSSAEITNENGKRKSDNDAGNVKKRTKLTKEPSAEEQRLTRSKRKSLSDTKQDKSTVAPPKTDSANSNHSQKKSKLRLTWLKSSKQPSILSKFCSLSKQSDSSSKCSETRTHSIKTKDKTSESEQSKENSETTKTVSGNESSGFELVEKMFQGELVLRTRCLECESFTERREDFQDISVPVLESEPPKLEDSSDLSPDPRLETKTLKWAISQFASVERIVGEDKYFCEKCHHYTEAERSLLFDKIPDIVTIHLKCFSANSSEFDCFGGLSKVNTALLTPLDLSLEEWSTNQSKDLYRLFAVVMHSGVTISSGHYTAYVRIPEMSDLERDHIKTLVDHKDVLKAEPLNEDEARMSDANYDDGEVSFRVNGCIPSASKVSKKQTETVSLLGGQKSKPDFQQLPNKSAKSETVLNSLGDESYSASFSVDLQCELSEERNLSASSYTCKSANSTSSFLESLKEYLGKWLLFDDSEVKVTEEKDFMTAISPNTLSTSTPYLLFYKKLV
ncbi:ubiquitin specific peptidase 1 S homeolog isoform X1 [Xenopus laevis]|uniref:Ubiquitin carboxyl-terminal hydrolase n=2 Tax=Xenopus laevis TaxID=8355 RepID=A0A974HLX0_XENLA|nr:ubiquitin specific peptidase 1 S homeolog isoform X1 [Xenopus laevis]OCT82443.1 hypothetical protein XELAEV_18024973mg [Xenopus laevis]